MARKKNSKLNRTAVKIGTALGKADRGAHRMAHNARNTVDELRSDIMDLAEAAERLAHDLRKTSARLKKSLR